MALATVTATRVERIEAGGRSCGVTFVLTGRDVRGWRLHAPPGLGATESPAAWASFREAARVRARQIEREMHEEATDADGG